MVNTYNNPFTFGAALNNPQYFIGRLGELRKIIDCLKKDENVSLVGGRRFGKTSLMNYLAQPEVHELNAWEGRKLFLHFNLGMLSAGQSVSHFWHGVLNSCNTGNFDAKARVEIIAFISKQEKLNGKQEQFAPGIVNDFLYKLASQGYKIIILLDEFERSINPLQFNVDFFANLRTIADLSVVAFVIATPRVLSDLDHSEEIMKAYFPNIFQTIMVPNFNEAEADELITKYLHRAGAPFLFTDEEKSLAFQLSNRIPYYFQMACSFLYEAHSDGLPPPKRLVHMTKGMTQQSQTHFEILWEDSRHDEQKVFLRLAQPVKWYKNGIGFHKIHENKITENLLNSHWVIKVDKKYTLFSPLFASWILDNHRRIKGEGDSKITKSVMSLGVGIIFLAILVITLIVKFPEVLSQIGDLANCVGQTLDYGGNIIIGVIVLVFLLLIISGRFTLGDIKDIVKSIFGNIIPRSK